MRRSGNTDTPLSHWAHVPILTPECRLWRAVLQQAYEDAETPGVIFEEIPGTELFQDAQARSFLRADTPFDRVALKRVCEFADVPMDRVVSWARRCYSRAEVTEIKEIEETTQGNEVEEVEELKETVLEPITDPLPQRDTEIAPSPDSTP